MSEEATVQVRNGGEIEVQNVSKAFGVGRFAKPVIRSCSFQVRRNKLTVVIGPSGAGKSTLIRLIAGFDTPTSGSILFDGIPVTKPDSDRLVVFQETALYPWMTTHENILYGPKAQGRCDSATLRAAELLMERVGLSQFRNTYPNQLSGGMQRRAELARALINNPSLTILDEPFRGLDAMTKGLMQEYYARLFESAGRTHLFITTDVDEAIFLADELLIMSNRPMTVRKALSVNLPRPRRLADVIDDDHANELKMTALSILHEEAMKSFASGQRAAADFVEAYAQRYVAAKQ
jgi:NitT/TauT family transport system ATP-binding protein